MRLLLLSLITFTHLFCFNALILPEASAQTLTGKWINSQEGSYLPEITISEVNGGYFVEANGNCQGCNWGQVEAMPAAKTSANASEAVAAVYQFDGKEVRISAVIKGENLEVRLSEYIDHEDEKQSYNYLYSFLRPKGGSSANGARIHSGGSASGSISGSVFGKARSTAGIFQISLYGPNNRYISTHYFSRAKEYSFENLPDGTYFVSVESKGSTAIEAFPEFAKIIIKNGKAYQHDVELR